MSKIAINTENAPEALGPYSQAVVHGDLAFISGQIPLNPKKNLIEKSNPIAQIHQVFENLANVAQATGCDLNDCLKLTIFVTDMGIFDAVNEAMKDFFSEPYPARSVVEVKSLPKAADLEVDAILALSHD